MYRAQEPVHVGWSLVREALPENRHRRSRADLTGLLPCRARRCHPTQLAEHGGLVGVRPNEVGIQLHDLAEGVQRLQPSLCQVEGMAQRPEIEEGIARVQTHGLPHESDAVLWPAR